MDPDQALADVREARVGLENAATESDYSFWSGRLYEAVGALDEWMSRGGFPPKAWGAHVSI